LPRSLKYLRLILLRPSLYPQNLLGCLFNFGNYFGIFDSYWLH
jgi:hypothetical protein